MVYGISKTLCPEHRGLQFVSEGGSKDGIIQEQVRNEIVLTISKASKQVSPVLVMEFTLTALKNIMGNKGGVDE